MDYQTAFAMVWLGILALICTGLAIASGLKHEHPVQAWCFIILGAACAMISVHHINLWWYQ